MPIGNHISYNIVSSSNISLSKHLSYSFPLASIRNVNGIDFTCHSHLYCDIQRCINSLIPLIHLLMASFRLKCVFLFSHSDSPSYLSLQPSLTILKASFPSWYMSTHSLSSSLFGIKLSFYRSIIHGSSLRLLSSFHFTQNYLPQFSDTALWLFFIIDYFSFSLFTTASLFFSQTIPSSSVPFH